MENNSEIREEDLYPLVRESLKPFELILGLVIQQGNQRDLESIKRIVQGLMDTAEAMWSSFREHGGRLQS